MARAWVLPATMAALAVFVLVTGGADTVSIVTALVLLMVGWLISPLLFPRHVDDARARHEAAARGVPIVYWRPGCMFCVRLRLALGRRAGRALWVDIHRDRAAAARVRGFNGGNETVPTVVAGDEVRTNPDPGWLRARLP